MDGRVFLRILAALGVIALIAGVGVAAFNAGAATHIQVPAAPSGQAPYPYYGFGFWHPFWFLGFGFLGPLFGLLMLFFIVRLFLFVLFGPRWGRGGRMHRVWRHWGDENDVPPMFREWHDRAHGQAAPPEDTSKS